MSEVERIATNGPVGEEIMAIPKNCKRLAEVDFPLVPVARYSTKEKQKKTGTVASIHVWWARRPLASSRAMNLACLVPDPSDSNCPTELRQVIASAWINSTAQPTSQRQTGLKQKLVHSVNRAIDPSGYRSDFSTSSACSQTGMSVLTTGTLNALVHSYKGAMEEPPPVILDTFAGGGSIPLEAMRVGASAIATDLNPIPFLLNKLQLEHLPNAGNDFLRKVRKGGGDINTRLAKEFSDLYPVPKELEGQGSANRIHLCPYSEV